MPTLKPGTRLRSAVCTTEVMVIQAPAAEVDVTCGGAPMVPLGTPVASGASRTPGVSPQAAEGGAQRGAAERSSSGLAAAQQTASAGASEVPGTLIGKRYVNAAGDLELLCTEPGAGTLAAAGAPLTVKGAKPLPSSD